MPTSMDGWDADLDRRMSEYRGEGVDDVDDDPPPDTLMAGSAGSVDVREWDIGREARRAKDDAARMELGRMVDRANGAG